MFLSVSHLGHSMLARIGLAYLHMHWRKQASIHITHDTSLNCTPRWPQLHTRNVAVQPLYSWWIKKSKKPYHCPGIHRNCCMLKVKYQLSIQHGLHSIANPSTSLIPFTNFSSLIDLIGYWINPQINITQKPTDFFEFLVVLPPPNMLDLMPLSNKDVLPPSI